MSKPNTVKEVVMKMTRPYQRENGTIKCLTSDQVVEFARELLEAVKEDELGHECEADCYDFGCDFEKAINAIINSL